MSNTNTSRLKAPRTMLDVVTRIWRVSLGGSPSKSVASLKAGSSNGVISASNATTPGATKVSPEQTDTHSTLRLQAPCL
jgi:hypothetical protein